MSWYKSFKVPVNKAIEARFEEAAMRLQKKLLAIDVEKLEVSAYSKKYFKDYQHKLKYSLQACSFILMHALYKSNKNIEDITLVDYGAGTGVLAMLAKEVGFGKVIYNDIYDISCKDAETIANKAFVQANNYVCGDANALEDHFKMSHQYCDIIVSRNVIEHIYNLEFYFKSLSNIPTQGLTLFFATTANIKNPLTVWYTKRIQRMLEYKGMTTKWGKERDSLKPYLDSRKEIIETHFPELNQSQINQLATETRGLIKEEIISFTGDFIQSGTLKKTSAKGCNTCDPYTGNWAEHLVEIEKYNELFTKNGFSFNVVNGFYNTNYSQQWLNLITPIVNLKIKVLGKFGIYLAPFIGLEGQKNKT
jgi:2-polyprenyl-3-methyl-5-hydroxy-6-metoxy-1,4-benzoquinol methylase